MAQSNFTRLKRILTGNLVGGGEEEPLLEAGLSRLERFAHFWVLVAQSFVRNRCPVRAAALSYSTLLALIPMLAVAVGVTSVLLKKEGEAQIYQAVEQAVAYVMSPADLARTNAPQDWENFDWFADELDAVAPDATAAAATTDPRVLNAQKVAAKYIHDFIQNAQSGTLGTLGMLLLVFVAIRMMANIEETLNDIWGVTRGRSWYVRIVLYWTVLTLGSLLLIAAAGLASGPHFAATRSVIAEMPFIGGLVFNFLPLLVVWLVFTLFYQLVPNTKVQFGAALAGGGVGGALWFLNNYFGFLYVSRVVSNSKIYGSLGLLPVFMAGLYFSWLILLFGAQVAYAFQNRAAYLQDRLAENVNQRGREFIALRLMTCISERFHRGLAPATAQDIATELGVPSRLVQQVLRPLAGAHLVTEIGGANPAYCPARPLDAINCHQILQAMRCAGGQTLFAHAEPAGAEIYGEFARIEAAEKAAAAAVTLQLLVHRAEARPELAPPAVAAAALPPVAPTPVVVAAEVEVVPAPPAPAPAPPPPVAVVAVETPKPALGIATPDDTKLDFPL